MSNLKQSVFWGLVQCLVFSFSTSKGDLKQSLNSIESGQSDVEKYGMFISQDAAMKRILRLNEDALKRERTERLLKKLDSVRET